MLTQKKVSLKKRFIFFVVGLVFGQSFAMDNDSIEAYKNQGKKDHEKVELSMPISQFKQRTISLSINAEKKYPLEFDRPGEGLITHYLLDGKPVAQLMQINDSTRFESHDPNKYDFLLQSCLKTSVFEVSAQGGFAFQKAVDAHSASLVCKSVEFLDTFSSEHGLIVDADCCDNLSDVSCEDACFKGRQCNFMSGSSLVVRTAVALLLTQGVFNDGAISCARDAIVSTPLFENDGSFNSGNVRFDGGEIVNNGAMNIDDSFSAICESFEHHGKFDVGNDCIFEKVGTFSTARSSWLNVGRDWKAQITHLWLKGDAAVGNLALFAVDSHARFGGYLSAPIIHVESNDLITCNLSAHLMAAYHIGLKAKGWMQFEGDLLKKFLQLKEQSSYAQKLGPLVDAFPQGVFLCSEQSGIKTSGNVVSKSGVVCWDAKKGLTHAGLTETGLGPDAMLLMNAASLNLEKESILEGLNARLSAHQFINQFGAACFKNNLIMQAPEVGHHGSSQAGNLLVASDNFSASRSSQITTENGAFEVQKKLAHAGELTVFKQLGMNAESIHLEDTSRVSAHNANFKADETVRNDGDLNVSDNLLAHAKFVENSKSIKAKSAHIKADRYWWNKRGGIITVDNGLTIDALFALNTLGWTQANDLTINTAFDFNLLGMYRAKNTNVNALLGLNAGILVPKFDSLGELCSRDNAWKVGECLFTKFCPSPGLVYSLGKGVKGVCSQSRSLYGQLHGLYGQEETCVSDWLPLLCGAKNLVKSSIQTTRTGQQAYRMGRDGTWKWCIDLDELKEQVVLCSEPEKHEVVPSGAMNKIIFYSKKAATQQWEQIQDGCWNIYSFDWKNVLSNIYQSGQQACQQVQDGCSAVYSVDWRNVPSSIYQTGQSGCQKAQECYKAIRSVDLKGIGFQAYRTVQGECLLMRENYRRLHYLCNQPKKGSQITPERELRICSVKQTHEILQKIVDLFPALKLKSNQFKLQIASDLVAAVGPQFNRDVLFDFNGGIALGVNGHSSSLCNINAGVSIFSNKNTVDTYYGTNYGVLGASILTVNAIKKYTYSSGIVGGITNATEAQNIILEDLSRVIAYQAYFKASETFNNKGDLNVLDKWAVQAKWAENSGVIVVKGAYVKAYNKWLNREMGSATVESGIFESQGNITNAGDLTASKNVVMRARDVIFEDSSRVAVESASLKASEEFSNLGRFGASGRLEARAKFVNNLGSMAADSAQLNADRWWYNHWTGTVKVEHGLTIDALFSENACGLNEQILIEAAVVVRNALASFDIRNFNKRDLILASRFIEKTLNPAYAYGSIEAGDFTVNSFLDCNSGKCRVKNARNRSFIAINTGHIEQKIDSMDDLLTCDNARKVRDHLVTVTAYAIHPLLGVGYSLTKVTIGICKNGKATYERYKNLPEDAGISDWMPIACDVKSLMMSAVQAGDLVHQGYQMQYPSTNANNTPENTFKDQNIEPKNLPEIGNKSIPKSSSTGSSEANSINWRDTASEVVGATFQVASELVSICGPQINRETLFDFNIGTQVGLNGHSSSLYNFNGGVSLFANKNTIDTRYGTNIGVLGAANLSINATRTYTSPGAVGGVNVGMTAENLNISGPVGALNNTLLKAHNKATVDANIYGNQVSVQAKEAELKDNTHIVARTKATVVGEDRLTSQADIKGKQIHLAGKNVTLQNGSNLRTEGGSDTVVLHASEHLEAEKGSNIASRVVVIKAPKVDHHGSLRANTLFVDECKNISASESSNIVVENSVLDVQEKVVNAGGLTISNQLSATVHDMELTKTSRVNINNAQIKVDGTASNDGDFNVSETCTVQAKVVENSGLMGGDGLITLQVEHLDLKDGSRIAPRVAHIDAQSVSGAKGNVIAPKKYAAMRTGQLDNHGSAQGIFALQFTGAEDQLKSIGQVDHIEYGGTLANDLADMFANGHNDRIDIATGGSATLLADKQYVHLKEEHTIGHGFYVKTETSVACDKPITSEQPILLDAGQDVACDSLRSKVKIGLVCKNLHAKSHVEREYDGENYKDILKSVDIAAPKVDMDISGNLECAALNVCSDKNGTNIVIGGQLIDAPVVTEEYSRHASDPIEKTCTTTTGFVREVTKTSHVSSFSSGGVTNLYLTGRPEFFGTKFNSADGTNLYVPKGIGLNVAYDIHIQETESSTTGITKEDAARKQETHVPLCPDFQGGPVHIVSDVPVVLPITGNAKLTVDAPAAEYVPVETESASYEYKDGEWVRLVAYGKTKAMHDVVYDKVYKGPIEANVNFMHVIDAEGHAPVDVLMLNPHGKIEHSLVKEVHECKPTSYYRPTKLGMCVVALSLSLATSGACSSVGAGLAAKICLKETLAAAMVQKVTAGTLMMVNHQAVEALLYCNGDLKAAARQFASIDSGKRFAFSILTLAAMAGADYGLDKIIPVVSKAKTFGERVAYTLPRQGAHAGIRTVAGIASGCDPKEVIKDNAKMMAANTIGIAGSSHIGKAYHDKKMSFVAHKAAHVALGAVEGAILNGFDGAMAGGFAAGVAEVAADIFGPEKPSVEGIFEIEKQLGRQLTSEEFKNIWTEQNKTYTNKVHAIADASKIAAVTAAFLLQQDIDVAYDTASIAVDNNFLNIVQFAVVGADLAEIGYNAVVAYQEGGMEEALKQLGVDVQYTVQNYVKYGAVFILGGAAYPSVKKALDVLFKVQPGLKTVLGGFVETLYVGGKKFLQSTPGKYVERAGKSINKLDAKLGNVKQKAGNKLGQQFGVGLDGLVDFSVPGSVLNNLEKQTAKQAAKSGTAVVEKALAAEASLVAQEVKVASGAGTQDVAQGVAQLEINQVTSKSVTLVEEAVGIKPVAPDVRFGQPSIVIDEAMANLSSQELAKLIKKNEALILESVKEPLANLAKEGNRIKEIADTVFKVDHTFSEEHIEKGLLKLGVSPEDITKKYLGFIKEADLSDRLIEGTNTIRAYIQDTPVEIHIHILKGDLLRSVNFFVGHSDRRVKNLIEFFK